MGGIDRSIAAIRGWQLQTGGQPTGHMTEDMARAAMMLGVVAGRLGVVGMSGTVVAVGIMPMIVAAAVVNFVDLHRRMLVRRHAAGRFPAETRREDSQQHDHDQQAGNESGQHLDSTLGWTNYTITDPA